MRLADLQAVYLTRLAILRRPLSLCGVRDAYPVARGRSVVLTA
ncbi:hypothetical protein EDWATA_01734 [Edwardsiella tarda ATCC 23685]|uniref:Uncharacterized protein n=1 Tax=Edwardsiella tarda ATCC 23685 TaxID=500638 RepID=D4F4R1_EDWTA|nr:hypothetical protein EDWATA_01734 [Edwardsiella tarda ATCC 23685]